METNKIFQGSVLDILKTFPDESVDCIITSPPYYGLRDYGEETKTIWGGDRNCEHVWQKEITSRPNASGGKTEWAEKKLHLRRKGKENFQEFVDYHDRNTISNFCQKCQAWRGQLGLEPTFNLYLEHMLLITAELKRVLKNTGTLWWNHGDSYASQHTGGTPSAKAKVYTKLKQVQGFRQPNGKKVFPEKSLMLQAHRLAIKMIDEQDWILRNQIIWHKPNCMPSSIKDRFTMDYEPVFFFTKSNETLYWTNEKTLMITDKQPKGIHGKEGQDWEWRDCPSCKGKGCKEKSRCIGGKIKYNFWEGRDYWFEPQYEQYTEPLNRWGGPATKATDESKGDEFAIQERDGRERRPNASGRNKRSVWKIPTKPFSEAHFATFPPTLIETPIKAGCPEFICKKCGVAREKTWKRTGYPDPENNKDDQGRRKSSGEIATDTGRRKTLSGLKHAQFKAENPDKFLGYTNCGCNAGWTPGIVLDPFMGSGTTAIVAESLNRLWLGIELNPKYIKMAEKRIAAVPKSLFSL